MTGVTTLFLKWSDLGLFTNLLVKEYHNWAVGSKMCEIMLKKNSHHTRQRFCNTDKLSIIPPSPIQADFLHPQAMIHVKGRDFPKHVGLPDYVTFILIIQDTVITNLGYVISNNFKLQVEAESSIEKFMVPARYNETIVYDEVISIAHLYVKNAYHLTIDGIQRMIPYLTMLKKFPHVKIHVKKKNSFITKMLAVLGIKEERLITGVIRAKIAYVPEFSYVWYLHVPNIQLLSYTFRQITIKEGHQERKSLVHIIRTFSRFFKEQDKIKNKLQDIALQYGLKYEEYLDTKLPSIKETIKLFDRAVLVFAPHGAGLFNMIFCRPGTFIIEVLCPDHPTLSYMRLAHSLGHRYYSYVSNNSEINGNKCERGIIVDSSELFQVVRFYATVSLSLIN